MEWGTRVTGGVIVLSCNENGTGQQTPPHWGRGVVGCVGALVDYLMTFRGRFRFIPIELAVPSKFAPVPSAEVSADLPRFGEDELVRFTFMRLALLVTLILL